jgi:cobalt-zinc-cadmium efflux system membrane fusion protein
MRPLTRLAAVALSAILAGAAGCRKHEDAGGHAHGPGGHEHAPEVEMKTAQITVWTNGYEIFAEHTPPVAGRGTPFITHIAELESGKARSSGGVKFVLRQGTTIFEHPQAGPERPGIYIPAIAFPKEGEWEATVIIPGQSNRNAMVNLGTIRVFPTEAAAAKAQFPDAPEGISFLKEQQWRILAKTEPATRRSVVERVALHATVVPAPGSKATVHSPVTGRLLGEDVVRLGSEVKAGDILGWVEPAFNEFTAKLVEAEAEASRAAAVLEQTKVGLERTRSLFEQQAKSQREVQEAELAYRSAQAAFESARTIQQLYRATGATFQDGSLRIALKAPFAGVVDRVAAGVGQRVEPEQPVFTIVNPKPAMVQAQVPETLITRLQPKLGATLQIGEVVMTNGLTFVAMGRELDSATRSLLLTYALEREGESDQSIAIGAAGTLSVATGKAAEAVAIPAAAIVEEEGVAIAFVQVSGETFEKRDVKPGVQDGRWTEIISGVSEGERVVTDGAYTLLLSTKSGTIPAHGHAH